jgi:pimeloyl-ACP methyl ester carboxylesterase
MAIDANRNGLIEFGTDTTSPQKPFRYWINDDHDHGENDDDLSGGANHSDSIINGIRDLEDVTQVKFKMPQVLIDMAKAGTAQLGFKWKDVTQGSPSVRIWSGSPNIDKPDYLKDRNTAFTTLDQNIVVGTARLVSGTSSVWLRNNLMNEATSDTVNLLMEGVTVGVGKLTFMIKVGTQESEGPSIDLKLLNVRQMFERAKITPDAPNIQKPWENPNPQPLTCVSDPWNWPPDIDPNADNKTIVYVHGWRMTYNEYLQWADTSFKRLWQIGYKGRFYTVRWPTFSAENDGIPDIVDPALYAGSPGGLTYNPSEYRAWLSGPALANFVNGLPNANARYLIAHSMGNVVAGSALRNNMQVTRYAMCNSAMAAMAYDASIIDYPNYNTPDTDADAGTRQAFGLANKLNPVPTKIVNFSLGPDRALVSWEANNLLFKPQVFGFSGDKAYDYSASRPLGQKLSLGILGEGTWHELRPVTSLPESMAYVTRSRSKAAGGRPETGGSVSSFVNMGVNGFEFGNEHSAQWVYSIQKTYPFWRSVAEEFNIDLVNR